MTRLVGISGAQGAGKSTLLTFIKITNPEYFIDDFKVSRAVQKDLGWENLNRVMDSLESMLSFQHEILSRKMTHDHSLRNSDKDIVFVERTFADIFAYTSSWIWKFYELGKVSFDEAINLTVAFQNKCEWAQKNIYTDVILLPLMDHILWEEDPNRASREDANSVFEDIVTFSEHPNLSNINLLTITAKSSLERYNEVQNFLKDTK